MLALLPVRSAAGQQRPLETQDPEPIGAGLVRIGIGTTYAWNALYPLSGLQGNLFQLAVVALDVGISAIADFQLSGGPYNRLSITGHQSAPLAALVTATGTSTHAVEDIVIGTKIRLLSESARPAVAFRFAVRLPNAKHESGLGQDTTDFSASLLVGRSWGSLRVVGNGGITIMSEPLDAAKQNDVVAYGASMSLALSRRTDLVGEVNGRWSVRRGIPPVGTESRGIVKAGLRQAFAPFYLDAAALFGVTSIDPSAGFTVGVTFTFKAFSVP
jgi:hypothetical protein